MKEQLELFPHVRVNITVVDKKGHEYSKQISFFYKSKGVIAWFERWQHWRQIRKLVRNLIDTL